MNGLLSFARCLRFLRTNVRRDAPLAPPKLCDGVKEELRCCWCVSGEGEAEELLCSAVELHAAATIIAGDGVDEEGVFTDNVCRQRLEEESVFGGIDGPEGEDEE